MMQEPTASRGTGALAGPMPGVRVSAQAGELAQGVQHNGEPFLIVGRNESTGARCVFTSVPMRPDELQQLCHHCVSSLEIHFCYASPNCDMHAYLRSMDLPSTGHCADGLRFDD